MDNLSLHILIIAAAIFVLVKDIGNNEEGVVYRMCTYSRKDFFGVYLIHPLFLLLFDIPQIRDLSSHIITIPLISIIVFIMSLFAIKWMRCVPKLRKFIE